MWVVKSTVRPLVAGQLRNELSGVLLPAELEWLLEQPHRPLALGQVGSIVNICATCAPATLGVFGFYMFNDVESLTNELPVSTSARV
jgi:hypothetical protein